MVLLGAGPEDAAKGPEGTPERRWRRARHPRGPPQVAPLFLNISSVDATDDEVDDAATGYNRSMRFTGLSARWVNLWNWVSPVYRSCDFMNVHSVPGLPCHGASCNKVSVQGPLWNLYVFVLYYAYTFDCALIWFLSIKGQMFLFAQSNTFQTFSCYTCKIEVMFELWRALRPHWIIQLLFLILLCGNINDTDVLYYKRTFIWISEY